jgi:hypothetical protein
MGEIKNNKIDKKWGYWHGHCHLQVCGGGGCPDPGGCLGVSEVIALQGWVKTPKDDAHEGENFFVSEIILYTGLIRRKLDWQDFLV